MMLKQYFVECYNEKKIEDSRYRGVIIGESFSEMVNKLENYYGCSDEGIKITSIEIYNVENEGCAPDGLYEIETL